MLARSISSSENAIHVSDRRRLDGGQLSSSRAAGNKLSPSIKSVSLIGAFCACTILSGSLDKRDGRS